MIKEPKVKADNSSCKKNHIITSHYNMDALFEYINVIVHVKNSSLLKKNKASLFTLM